MARKATNSEAKKRTTQVIKMLLVGASRAEILQYAAENWKIAERTTDDYIVKANAYFAEAAIVERDEQLGLALQRLNDLYKKTMHIDDYKAALSVQKEIISLLGLQAPNKFVIDDWRTQLLVDIRAGELTLEQVIAEFGGKENLVEAIDEPSLAARLFAAAGIQLQSAEAEDSIER